MQNGTASQVMLTLIFKPNSGLRSVNGPNLEANQNKLLPVTFIGFSRDPVGTSQLPAQRHQLLQQTDADPGCWVSSINTKCRLSKVKSDAIGRGKTHLLNKDGRANPAPPAGKRHRSAEDHGLAYSTEKLQKPRVKNKRTQLEPGPQVGSSLANNC